jgi:hypothetical protein
VIEAPHHHIRRRHRRRHDHHAVEEESGSKKRTIFSNYGHSSHDDTAAATGVASNDNGHHQHQNHHAHHYSSKSDTSGGNTSANNAIQRDYMAAVIGKDVQLDCKMKNLANDDDKIVWLKMPKGEVLTLNSNRVTQDMRIGTKCIANSLPCWSLIVTNTRESDTGFYVCQTNAMQTKYVYLDIMGLLLCFYN